MQETWDILCLLLMIRINYHHQLIMNKRRIPCLDDYLDRINIALWPRFKVIAQVHITLDGSYGFSGTNSWEVLVCTVQNCCIYEAWHVTLATPRSACDCLTFRTKVTTAQLIVTSIHASPCCPDCSYFHKQIYPVPCQVGTNLCNCFSLSASQLGASDITEIFKV